MGISDHFSLKQAANASLQSASYDPRKLVLIHTAAASVFTLITAVLSFLIQDGISGTGGLGGIGLRSILSTASSVLQNISNLVLPFWSFGYLIAMMKIVRREQVGPKTLLGGFYHIFPILRLILLRGLMFVGIGFLCLYPSVIIFTLTPFSDPLTALMEPVMNLTSETDIAMYLDDATLEAISSAMIPMLVIYLLLYLLISIPLSYKLRFSDYALMDDPQAGARYAMRTSFKLTQGNCINLLKLDLSFWWYFLAEVLLIALCYGDVCLALLGISLPISSTAGYFVFYVLYLLAQLVLYWFVKNQVEATYAAAYNTLQVHSEANNPPRNY